MAWHWESAQFMHAAQKLTGIAVQIGSDKGHNTFLPGMMLVRRTESLVDLGTDSVASDCCDNKDLESKSARQKIMMV